MNAQHTETFAKWSDALDAGIEHGGGYTITRNSADVFELTTHELDGEISHLWESWYAQWLHENIRTVLGLAGEHITRVACDMEVRREDHEDVRWFDCVMWSYKLNQQQLDDLHDVDFVITREGWGLSLAKDDVTIEIHTC